jgi:hypothetical protein
MVPKSGLFLRLLGDGVLLSVAAGSHEHLLHGGVNGLLDLVSLLLVGNDEGVQELAAADLELSHGGVLLHLDAAGVLAGANGEELLKVLNLTRHAAEILKLTTFGV